MRRLSLFLFSDTVGDGGFGARVCVSSAEALFLFPSPSILAGARAECFAIEPGEDGRCSAERVTAQTRTNQESMGEVSRWSGSAGRWSPTKLLVIEKSSGLYWSHS